MNDAELYARTIKVDVAKPHRGMQGLDSSLPGMLFEGGMTDWVVWQQEEWIKANVNVVKDGEGDAMQDLEFAGPSTK
jgi:hypothetical protein